jgi:hypothetical protein
VRFEQEGLLVWIRLKILLRRIQCIPLPGEVQWVNFLSEAVLIAADGLVLAACSNPSGSNDGGGDNSGNGGNGGSGTELEEMFNGTPAKNHLSKRS